MFVHVETHAESLYERVGGETFFIALVDRFYAGVEDDPVVRSLYPDDLGPPKRRLALFLAQYWGGPRTYTDERGDPRLRMRHFPFRIGQPERDAWLRHMLAAVQTSAASPEDRNALSAYFETAATSLINRPG
ncbi:MAG: globin [Chloroflexota bacterium]|nr:globin [Chloroflexota bacterium]